MKMNFKIFRLKKKKRIKPSAKNLLSSFWESCSVLNLSTLSASSLVPDSRSVSTTSHVVQFFSEAAHHAMYWLTVFLLLGDQETTPKKSSTQGQGTTTFRSLSCFGSTCTKYNLRKRCTSCSNNTLNITAHGVYSNSWWNLSKACH